MKLLVTGGRNYTDKLTVYHVLDRMQTYSATKLEIIEGGQRTRNQETRQVIGGADYWAYVWAKDRGHKCQTFKADWKQFKKAAGPIRNRQMLEEGRPDKVLAFKGGDGTKSMVTLAEAAGVPVIRAEAWA